MNHPTRCIPIYAFLVFALILPVASAQESSRTKRQNKLEKDQKPSSGSVYMVDPAGADYLSGEANVAVTGNQNPVIRLGLSPNGATIIEFPAADRLFNIIPGNSNLVTVEESPTKATDRFIIARPGDGFTMPATMANARRAPAASVLVQMQSGLVLTFLFYPVPQLSEQAHRVVVIYDRNEVVAARRAAGLAVNLDSLEDEKRKTSSLRVPAPPDSPALDATPVGSSPSRAPRQVADTAEIDGSLPPEKWGGMRDEKISNPAQITGLALTEAARSPKNFKKWSDSVHGLSLSVSPVREINKRSQLVVIAARNTKEKNARILPDQPELYLETLDSNGKPIQIELVKKIATASTAKGEVIPGGEIRYYVLIYETPILSARQRLRVIVGQTIAADEPAAANLSSVR